MKNWQIIIPFLFLIIFILLNTGCKKNKLLYPASDIQITSTSPYSILPTSNSFSEIEDGVITIRLLNSIPCTLVSYDLTYETVLGEPIENLSITQIPVELPLSAEGSEESLTIKPYTQQLLNLFMNSSSSISPVRSTVVLHFKDVNENEIVRTASFLLYKYEASSSE